MKLVRLLMLIVIAGMLVGCAATSPWQRGAPFKACYAV